MLIVKEIFYVSIYIGCMILGVNLDIKVLIVVRKQKKESVDINCEHTFLYNQ
jgi:hypothetical protein